MKCYLIAIMHYATVVEIIGGTTNLNKAKDIVSKINRKSKDKLDVYGQVVRYIPIPEKACEFIANKWNEIRQAELKKFLEED